MIDSDALRTFACFAEDANLSRAAKRLHLSQPAVHAHVKRLEASLGVPLYRRSGRSLTLTPEGVEVAAFARESAERTRELVLRLRGEPDDGRVVLAAGAGALLHVLGDAIRHFTRTHAGSLEVRTCDGPSALAAVREGTAHVGVTVLENDEAAAGLDVHTVTTVPQVLVVPRAHPLARRRGIHLAHLAGERLVMPPPGRPQRLALDVAFAARTIRPRVAAVATGWELVVHLVSVGAGIAIVNACVALPRALVARPLRELPSQRYVAFVRGRPKAAAAELVRAIVDRGDAWKGR